jgi:hypothetical protein
LRQQRGLKHRQLVGVRLGRDANLADHATARRALSQVVDELRADIFGAAASDSLAVSALDVVCGRGDDVRAARPSETA